MLLRILTICLLSISFISPAQYTWVEVWSDEFNGTEIDNSLWGYDVGGGGFGNQEAQYYTDRSDNSYIDNGKLVIEAKKESFGGNDYTSAKLISQNKGDWKYGKFEIRAKLPTGNGLWPAIWMLPTNSVYGGWPSSGEIDIMENVGYDPNIIHWNIHTEAYNHTINTNKGTSATFTSPSDNFYTYGLEWFEDYMIWTVDGVEQYRFDKEPNGYTVWPFDQEFYLILNVAVGGTWGGSQGINDNVFPQKMEVDFVRVYEYVEIQNEYALDADAAIGGTVSSTQPNGNIAAGTSVTLTAIPDAEYEFSSWSGTFGGSTNPITFDMDLPVTMTALFQRKNNLILNGNFVQGLNSWWAGNGGSSTVTTDENGFNIEIQSTSTNSWDKQLVQGSLDLKDGCDYSFNLISESDANTSFNAAVGLNASPWTVYTSETVTLEAGVEKLTTKSFTMNGNNPSARVVFDLGHASPGTLQIKETWLIESCIVGNEEIKESSRLSVYPNPTTSILRFGDEYLISIIVLSDHKGYNRTLLVSNNEVDISDIPKGSYIITFPEQPGVSKHILIK